jgi:hypothetical protein
VDEVNMPVPHSEIMDQDTRRLASGNRQLQRTITGLIGLEQSVHFLALYITRHYRSWRDEEIRGSHVRKMWRFRASDLNAWLDRQERAS